MIPVTGCKSLDVTPSREPKMWIKWTKCREDTS